MHKALSILYFIAATGLAPFIILFVIFWQAQEAIDAMDVVMLLSVLSFEASLVHAGLELWKKWSWIAVIPWIVFAVGYFMP